MAPKKSKIWDFFIKTSDELVKCNFCLKLFKSSKNTTNMIQHIKLKHPKQFNEKFSPDLNKEQDSVISTDENSQKSFSVSTDSTNIDVLNEDNQNAIPSTSKTMPQSKLNREDVKPSTSKASMQQSNIRKMFGNVQSYKEGGERNIKITEAVVQMIVLDNLPFRMVEGKGFIHLMKKLAPLYNIPTRNTIKSHVDLLYNQEVKKFRDMLQEVNHLSMTSDIWTDSQMNSMLGITIHGLKDNNLFSGTIGVFKLSESHTAAYISDVIEQALKEFQINSEDIVAIVTDNGANMVKAICDKFGKQKHIPCFAHTLNLVCDNSLEIQDVKTLISKCRSIVTYIKKHVNASDMLRKKQLSNGIPEGKILKLILDVKTRWNSTYYMLERLVKLLSYVGQILLEYVDAPTMLSSIEKEDIIEIISLLRPLEAMTTQISGDKYATLSQVIPLVRCGHEQLDKIKCKFPTSVKLKEKILYEFERRFGQVEKSFLLAASTLMDPRFKNIHFNDPLAMSSTLKKLRNEISDLEDVIIETPQTIEETSSDEEFDLWAHHKSLMHNNKRMKIDSSQTQDEFTLYLRSPLSTLTQNPIEIWEDMKSVYPNLYKLSRKYCHLIGTSVPSERLFSKAGATATEKRNRLTTNRLSKLLFLNSWLQLDP